MSAFSLLTDLRRLGVELQTDGYRLRWRPERIVAPEMAEEILANREGLIGLLTAPSAPAVAGDVGVWTDFGNVAICPSCRHPLDLKGRCWRCCDRACSECGRPTGSAFIATCCSCGHAFNGNRGEPP